MSQSDSNEQSDPLPVTIELHLHWQCPHCQATNSFPLPEDLPKLLTCGTCQRVSRTLINE